MLVLLEEARKRCRCIFGGLLEAGLCFVVSGDSARLGEDGEHLDRQEDLESQFRESLIVELMIELIDSLLFT